MVTKMVRLHGIAHTHKIIEQCVRASNQGSSLTFFEEAEWAADSSGRYKMAMTQSSKVEGKKTARETKTKRFWGECLRLVLQKNKAK
jgi:hypothetical protein